MVHLNLLEDIVALSTTCHHEGISLYTPSEFVDTRLDDLVKTKEMLLEELPLVLVDEQHDVVIVTDNQHHILTQLSQPVPLGVLTCEGRWNLQRVKGLHLVPILYFDQVLQEFSVEVTREKS